MQVTQYKVKIKLIEDMLGTVSKDENVYKSFILAKSKEEGKEDELETIGATREERGWTGFHMLDGYPIIYDYVIKGFFKAACEILRRDKDNRSSSVKAYKKVIDGGVHISPRRIKIDIPDWDGKFQCLERPLRAETAQGPRICLMRSDVVPAESTLSFTVDILTSELKEALIKEWLGYGKYRGLGQWRNASYGRFEVVEFE